MLVPLLTPYALYRLRRGQPAPQAKPKRVAKKKTTKKGDKKATGAGRSRGKGATKRAAPTGKRKSRAGAGAAATKKKSSSAKGKASKSPRGGKRARLVDDDDGSDSSDYEFDASGVSDDEEPDDDEDEDEDMAGLPEEEARAMKAHKAEQQRLELEQLNELAAAGKSRKRRPTHRKAAIEDDDSSEDSEEEGDDEAEARDSEDEEERVVHRKKDLLQESSMPSMMPSEVAAARDEQEGMARLKARAEGGISRLIEEDDSSSESGGDDAGVAVGERRSSRRAKRHANKALLGSDDSGSEDSELEARRARGRGENTILVDDDADSDDAGTGTTEPALALEDLKRLFMRRMNAERDVDEPYFEDLATGCYVKICIDTTARAYRVAEIVKVIKIPKPYRTSPTGKWTSRALVCKVGNAQKVFRISHLSNESIKPEEFELWRRKTLESGARLPKPSKFAKLELQKNTMRKDYVYTTADIEKMVWRRTTASEFKKMANPSVLRLKLETRQEMVEAELAQINRDIDGTDDEYRKATLRRKAEQLENELRHLRIRVTGLKKEEKRRQDMIGSRSRELNATINAKAKEFNRRTTHAYGRKEDEEAREMMMNEKKRSANPFVRRPVAPVVLWSSAGGGKEGFEKRKQERLAKEESAEMEKKAAEEAAKAQQEVGSDDEIDATLEGTHASLSVELDEDDLAIQPVGSPLASPVGSPLASPTAAGGAGGSWPTGGGGSGAGAAGGSAPAPARTGSTQKKRSGISLSAYLKKKTA